jgi:hypothetical protein
MATHNNGVALALMQHFLSGANKPNPVNTNTPTLGAAQVNPAPSPVGNRTWYNFPLRMIGQATGASKIGTDAAGNQYVVNPNEDSFLNGGAAANSIASATMQKNAADINNAAIDKQLGLVHDLAQIKSPVLNANSAFGNGATPTDSYRLATGNLGMQDTQNQLQQAKVDATTLAAPAYQTANTTGQIVRAANEFNPPPIVSPMGGVSAGILNGGVTTATGANPNPAQSSTTTIIPPNLFAHTSGSTHIQSDSMPGQGASVSIDTPQAIQALRAQQAATPQATGNEPAINGGAPVVNPTPTPVPVTSFPGLGMPQAPDNSLQSLTGQPTPTVNPTPTPGMMPDGSDPREISNVLSRLLSHIIGTNVSQ